MKYNLSNTKHSIFRMMSFSALGSGRVQTVEQKFLALVSIMLYAANKCSPRPFFGAWKGQRFKVDDDIFTLPPKIASYVWADKTKAPYLTDIYDPYYRKPPKTAYSNSICMSKMHLGVRTSDTAVVSRFVFMCPMCQSCYEANCNGISNTKTALLKQKSPWRAVDSLSRMKHEHKPILETIFKTLKRVHLIAGLDTEASVDVFLTAQDSNQHGTLVAQLFYCFPYIYSVREHAFAIDQTAPMLAFGKYTAMNGRFHLREQKQLMAYKQEVLLQSKLFVHYGRCTIVSDELTDSDATQTMLPYVSFEIAASKGIFPYHLFVHNTKTSMLYTTTFVRVWRAILTGYLKLIMQLTPPCNSSLLQHTDSTNATKRKTTVKEVPELRWINNAPEQTFCYIGNKAHLFYDGDCLTYEWLASVLDLYEHASALRQVPTPSCITLTLSGSYYRAACGQTVLDREQATCSENIVVGGCFSELVEVALSSAKLALLPANAVEVKMHDDVCDVLAYAGPEFDADLSKEIAFGILRAEHVALSTPDVCIRQSVSAFCDKVEHVSPMDCSVEDKPEPVDETFAEEVLAFTEHFASHDLLGTSPVIEKQFHTAIHNRYIDSVQNQVLLKKSGTGK